MAQANTEQTVEWRYADDFEKLTANHRLAVFFSMATGQLAAIGVICLRPRLKATKPPGQGRG